MKFPLMILVSIILLSNAESSEERSFIGQINERFLPLLESEITRTIRSEMSSDDELQHLESSGDSPENEYLKISDQALSSVSFTFEPSTTTATTTTTETTTSTTTISTTAAPLTTTDFMKTTKKPAQSRPQCIAAKDCYQDSECPMGKCLGSELGICDCNACVSNKRCANDADCGGLRNACDSTGYCDCVNAFHSHGYRLFVKVLLTFCHQTECTQTTDNCYGLPCRVGKCLCMAEGISSQPVHYFKPAGK